MKRMKSLVIAMMLAPALAVAQPKTADDWYKEGETQYNLGEFDKAADAFKQGFAAESEPSKRPAYLYNIAQAYRQSNRCKDSVFFYKRYLALKEQDTAKPLKPEKRAEVEQRIAELEACAKTQEATASTPTSGTGTTAGGGTAGSTGQATPGGAGAPGGATGSATAGSEGGSTKTTAQAGGEGDDGEEEGDEGEGEGDGGGGADLSGAPRLISARFVLGGTLVSAGDLDIGMRSTFGLVAGYPVVTQMNGRLLVDVGLALAVTMIPYENNLTGERATASLSNVLANAGVTYRVSDTIGVRGDLGLGALSLGGISEMGNPFTENAAGTTGALAMGNVRLALSADYALSPNLVATVTPFGFSFSPAKDGLRGDISSITTINVLVGVGYRM